MLRLGKFCGQLGPKAAYHTILIGLISSNNLRWLNILIKIVKMSFGGLLDYRMDAVFQKGKFVEGGGSS